jgi:hypothetical protein
MHARCMLPLAQVARPELPLLQLHELATLHDCADDDLRTTLRWLLTDELADAHDEDFIRRNLSKQVSRGFSAVDRPIIHNFLTEDTEVFASPAFKTPKANGVEARFVSDARVQNASIRWEQLGGKRRLLLPDHPQLMEDLLGCATGFEVDANAWFYQIGICHRLGRLYGVRIGFAARGGFTSYRHSAMPMGTSWSMFCAQTIARTIVKIVRRRMADCGFDRSSYTLECWIDNFIGGGITDDVTKKLHETLLDVMDAINMKYKDGGIADRIDVLGVSVNFAKKCITASDALKAKVIETLKVPPRTNRTFLQGTGLFQWGNFAVIRKPLALLQHVMDMVRNIGSTQDWDAQFTMAEDNLQERAWKQLSEQLNELLHWERIPDAQTARGARIKSIGWSDASCHTLGGVLQLLAADPKDDRDADLFAVPHDRPNAIFEAEFLAAATAWLKWQPDLQPIDNMPCYRALLKGSSSNKIGDALIRLWASSTKTPLFSWVDTTMQRADDLTRNVALRPPHRNYGVPRAPRWRAPQT